MEHFRRRARPSIFDGTMHAHLCDGDRIELVVHRRSPGGKVEDRAPPRKVEPSLRAAPPRREGYPRGARCWPGAGEEGFNTRHLGSVGEQPLARVRTQEPGPAREQDTLAA